MAAMDRFCWSSGLLELGETLVVQQRGVRLYDGEEKVMEAARPRAPGHREAEPGGCGHRRGSELSGAPQGWGVGLWDYRQLLGETHSVPIFFPNTDFLLINTITSRQ